MNPRLLIYTVIFVVILFTLANIYRSIRGDKSGKVGKKFNGKNKEDIEDAKFREEK